MNGVQRNVFESKEFAATALGREGTGGAFTVALARLGVVARVFRARPKFTGEDRFWRPRESERLVPGDSLLRLIAAAALTVRDYYPGKVVVITSDSKLRTWAVASSLAVLEGQYPFRYLPS